MIVRHLAATGGRWSGVISLAAAAAKRLGGRRKIGGEVMCDLFGNFIPLSVEKNHEHKQKTLQRGDGAIRHHVLLQREQALLHTTQLCQMTLLEGG